MDRSTPITLIAETHVKDEYGVLRSTETARTVYADVSSVSASEWFEGGRNGLNPEYRFRVFKYDYAGEKIVSFENVRYSIYRTFNARDDVLELYAERRKGNE